MSAKPSWTDRIALPLVNRPTDVTVDPNNVPGRVGVRHEDGKVWIRLEYQEYDTLPQAVDCFLSAMEANHIATLLKHHAREVEKETHGR